MDSNILAIFFILGCILCNLETLILDYLGEMVCAVMVRAQIFLTQHIYNKSMNPAENE